MERDLCMKWQVDMGLARRPHRFGRLALRGPSGGLAAVGALSARAGR